MQKINSDLIRGNIDTIILKTMLNGDMYGLDIIREVENKSNGTYELKQPTLYSCLKRLENQELISSYWLDSDIGGKRHYYKLTDKGHDVIKSKQEEWSKSKLLIDNLLGDFNYDEYRLVKKDDYDKIINGKPVIQYVPAPQVQNTNDSNSIDNEDYSINSMEDSVQTLDSNFDLPNSIENNNFAEINNQHFNNNVPFNQNASNPNISVNNLNSPQQNTTNENNSYINQINFQNTEISKNNNTNLLNNFENTQPLSSTIYEEISTDISNIKIEEKRPDPFDNELICFKQKESQDTNEIKEELQNTNFEQTSTFANLLKNDFELTTVIKEQHKTEINTEQQNLFDSIVMPYQNKVDTTIDEFTNNISKLNNFNYSGKEETIEKTENESQQNLDDLSETKEDNSNNENNSSSSEVLDEEDNANCFIQDNNIDILSELSQLNGFNSSLFENDDGYENDKELKTQTQNTVETVKHNEPLKNEQISNILNNNQATSTTNNEFLSELKPTFNENNDGIIYKNLSSQTQNTITYTETIEDKNYDSLFAPKEELDDIIYRNVSDYTSYNSSNTNYSSNIDYGTSIIPSYTEFNNSDSYKQKVQDLSEYTKSTVNPPAEIQFAKDINTLKEEYKKEGITVKEFNKTSSFKSSKNYIMINKLNLIKSLILLFGYVFVLSALFIIMDSTNLKNMMDFSFKYFLFGFIPFIVYSLYFIVMYFLNPYKKVVAKYSPRIMIFISIIISIQLLLITYCTNLQFGFYSFNQANYNHLLWIIPTILSFAPIFSTIIHTLLYRSKNFNI